MTEAEWLTGPPASDLAARMIEVVRQRRNDRRFRLLACAELRRYVWLDPRTAQALDLAERLADGTATAEQVAEFEGRTGLTYWNTARNPLVVPAVRFFEGVAQSGDPIHRFPPLIREIFGNPFRLTTFSPEWRTDTAVILARQMYESRDFSAMPILADALQDAGCDSDDVLTHCRGELLSAPHVRGCWVVDSVLGRE